jgi:hypothetical protein
MSKTAKDLIRFLKENGVSFVVPGCYDLEEEILVRALNEFMKTDQSDLIKKHRQWTYGCWDLERLKKNSDLGSYKVLEEPKKIKELLDLKAFFKDDEDVDFLKGLLKNKQDTLF